MPISEENPKPNKASIAINTAKNTTTNIKTIPVDFKVVAKVGQVTFFNSSTIPLKARPILLKNLTNPLS